MISKEIVFLDLCSGIGGFVKGFEDAGFTIKKHFFSEIDEHAIANYKYNFKNAEYVGPIELIDTAALGEVDVIAFGTPCQDFSIAGKRAGLDGERSSLILKAIEIVAEKKPTFFIWENVKGTFSSNDSEDFWAIIKAFANIGGYNIEWQLLNTLWLLPQNRERIYLVGHLASSTRSFKPIFPITEDDRLFNEPKEPRKGQPQTQFSGALNGKSDRASCTFIAIPKHAGTLTAGANSGGLHSDMTLINAEYYSRSQKDRVYNINGAMGCLSSNRLDNKTKIDVTVLNTQPRTGDPKKGGNGILSKENETYCLDTSNSTAILLNKNYRRLTEIECERLQGFPDNWTKFGIYEKKVFTNKKEKTFKIVTGVNPIASTNRYKLIGNAVTKNFPEIIAQRIIKNYL